MIDMKYVIASDVHGNIDSLRDLFRRVIFEKPAKVILLGDLYYHGPRNPLPEGYDPMETSKFLNEHKNLLIVVKGNCDAEVDQTISEFKFKLSHKLNLNDKKVLLVHGHKIDEAEIFAEYDVLIHGHTHVGSVKKKGAKIIANCGSIGLPKNNSPKSYLVLDEKRVVLKDITGKIIESANL